MNAPEDPQPEATPEFTPRGSTVTQRLLLMNGDMVDERITTPINAPSQITLLSPDDQTVIENVYLATLGRLPSTELREYFVGQLQGLNQDARYERVHDLFWVLINSDEFAWNH